MQLPPWGIVLAGFVLAAAAAIALVLALRRRRHVGLEEPDRIEELDAARRAELIRGTNLHLRELRYRYSIGVDRGERGSFSANINSVRLGFVPVTISENATERQGIGYAAFVHDGKRWCGPGLPCVGGPEQAVAHATRCVTPLAGASVERSSG